MTENIRNTAITSLPIHERISSLCSRITNAALSCHTLKSGQTGGAKALTRRRLDEIEVKKWLDGQLIEYQSMLMRRKKSKRQYMFTDDSKEGRRRIKMLKCELFDATVSNQQMRRLSSRMKMSAAMMFASYPEFTRQKPTVQALMEQMRQDGVDLGDLGETDDEELFLQQMALCDKLELTSRILKKTKELDELKQKSDQLDSDLTSNKNLPESDITYSSVSNSSTNTDGEFQRETNQIRMENAYIHQVLLNTIIAEQNIQWFNHDQLRSIVHKLGKFDSKLNT